MTKEDAIVAIIQAQELFIRAICTQQKIANLIGTDNAVMTAAIEHACDVFFERTTAAIEGIDD